MAAENIEFQVWTETERDGKAEKSASTASPRTRKTSELVASAANDGATKYFVTGVLMGGREVRGSFTPCTWYS